jgi:hypothetical protein
VANKLPKKTKSHSKKESVAVLELDVRALNQKHPENHFTTPKSREPSEEILNRLIYGSKAKISKKEMYALTRKNY